MDTNRRPTSDLHGTQVAGRSPRDRWRRDGLLLLLLALAIAGLATVPACSRGEKGKGAGSSDTTAVAKGDSLGEHGDSARAEEEALPVEVTVLGRGRIESVVRSSANLEAEAEVQVLAEAARQVKELRVEEGDRVTKGQLLLRLENEEQKSALAKAQVGFDQAKTEFDRQERLFEQNLAAERAYNDARHELDRARITLEDAQRELGYTEVRAPIAGTVTQRLVKVGDQVALGQRLFDIVDFESLVARLYVPERHIQEIREGQLARIRAEAVSAEGFEGRVERIAPVVDPRSGTVKVTVAVGAKPGLLPGMFVDVDLVTAVHADAVLLPKRALVYDGERAYAFRVQGRRAERIAVLPALADKDNVEPRDGFAAGDTVVVAGQAGLKDGSLIERVGDREAAAAALSGD